MEKSASQGKKKPCPYLASNVLSKLTFWWLTALFKKGYKNKLEPDDVYTVLPQDQSDGLGRTLESSWNREIRYQSEGRTPHLFRAVFLALGLKCIAPGIFLLIGETSKVLQPYFIGKLLGYFQDDSKMERQEAYIYATCLGICGLLQWFFNPQYFFLMHRIALQMKVATGSLIYKKLLKLSSQVLHKTNAGKVVNYLSTDIEKFTFATETFHYWWVAPTEIALTMYLIYSEIGNACFFGFALLIPMLPMQFLLGWLFGYLRTKIGKWSDKRIHSMHEVISGMRVIKMFCWENPFQKLVSGYRKKEMSFVGRSLGTEALNLSLFSMAPRFMFITMLIVNWVLGNEVSSKIVFVTLGWLEVLRHSVFLFVFFGAEVVSQLLASLKRVETFLLLEDMKETNLESGGRGSLYYLKPTDGDEVTLEMNNVTAIWKMENPGQQTDQKKSEESKLLPQNELYHSFALKDISLKVKKGELVAVIGSVGAGKSSLLMTLLGELPLDDGRATVCGNLGYVAQQPWVYAGTVRDNVLFGDKFNKERFDKVLNACALSKDVDMMAKGDLTAVGERGLLLSGGQKARITLARAVYRDYDIYLLDDPLSAVDTEVGKHIFNRCICDHLHDKTRILITHQVQYLKNADKIVMMREGRIEDIGTYDELQAKGTDVTTFLEHDQDEKEENMDNMTNEEAKEFDKTEEEAEIKAEDEEERLKGEVGFEVYKEYIKAGFGIIAVPFLLILGIGAQVLFISADWWLEDWTGKLEKLESMNSTVKKQENMSFSSTVYNSSDYFNSRTSLPSTDVIPIINIDHTYSMRTLLLMYGAYIIVQILFCQLIIRFCVMASSNLHKKMFESVLMAKTRFFEINPVGRILNKFSRDIGFMDDMLARLVFVILEMGLRLTGLLVATCVFNPWLIISLVPILAAIYVLRYYTLQTTRDLKRLEAVARSPVYSHITDTLHGLQTIRVLNMTDTFQKNFNKYQDNHTISNFMFMSSYRWFGIRSNGAIFIYLNIVIHVSLFLREDISSGILALSLTYVFMTIEPFEYYIRMSSELENYMTSVERVLSYTRIAHEPSRTSEKPPPDTWPAMGSITFNDLSLKYTDDGPVVLKNINCHIKINEKIGIVGRTGAGKSSLLSCLFRLAEPTGKIWIDGVDVLKIGLHELRNKISVIPQDPVLFSGPLRHNLDPFQEYSDDRLWGALEQVQLKEKICTMPGKLHTELAEAGKNFSVGQRQLICLARALLKLNKILVLDEATANVDNETDQLIQNTIRAKFRECTVLTVAHRLHTIMDSDRVMVLDDGELKEIDTPYKLLQREEGYFKHLVAQTGKVQSKHLHRLAFCAANKRASYVRELDAAFRTATENFRASKDSLEKIKDGKLGVLAFRKSLGSLNVSADSFKKVESAEELNQTFPSEGPVKKRQKRTKRFGNSQHRCSLGNLPSAKFNSSPSAMATFVRQAKSTENVVDEPIKEIMV